MPRGRALLPWVLALVGCAASVALWQVLLHQEERAIAAQFQLDAGEREVVFEERLEDAVKALHAVWAFCQASGEVRREQYSAFVGPLLELHPYIQAIGWNPLIADSERGAHEAETRAAGATGYRITERGQSGQMVPAARRAEYVAVQFMEPYEGNEAALGFDTASEPRRRRAIELARATRKLAVTARITLVQEEREGPGLLGFLPVFREAGQGVRSVPADGLDGFVAGVFRLRTLVDSALAPFDPLAIDFYITDESQPVGERCIFPMAASDHHVAAAHHAAGPALSRSRLIDFGGRQWRLLFVPTEDYLASLRTATPFAGLLTGLVLTLLATGYLALLVGEAARVNRLVGQRTGELRESNVALENEMTRRLGIERELLAYRNQLEQRVRERTAELESAEGALAESEERLQLTLGAVADGVWDWNLVTGEVFVSDSCLESTGYDRDEVETRAGFWNALIHPEDRGARRETVERHLAGEIRRYEAEYRVLSRSGEYRWYLGRGQVVTRDAEGTALRMVGTLTDIGERKLAEQRQSRIEQQVQRAQKLESLGVLAGGIAHDFNNLLAVILGGTDLARHEVPAESSAREHLELVANAATRAAELIRQIHAYSGHGTFALERIDIATLVDGVGQLLRSSVSKKARLTFDFAEALPEVEGDPSQLRQVVMNLIINASDALEGEAGGVEVSTSLLTLDDATVENDYAGEELEAGRYVVVQVSDDGAGMDAEVLERIFDPFFTTKKRGQGLGLAATLGIIRSHRGAVRVRSKSGRGTTVSVLLPCADALEAPPAREAETVGTDWRASGTALVVDDDPAVRRLAERMLDALGMEVLTAIDGQDGVESFAKHRDSIAVVLLDMSMPRMDGAEAFREIRRIQPDARVLLSSGYSELDSALLLTGDDRVAFVGKPYLLADLREKLKRVLAA